MTLTKVHSAANEQATLNAPTERKVVQRLAGEPGRAIANEAFIVVMNVEFDLLGSLEAAVPAA
jgi:hypothetical protein